MVLAARLVLAAVFGVAGIAKLMDREGLPRAIASFGLPARTGKPLGYLLVSYEFATALALIVNPWARIGALGALGLLLTFCLTIVVSIARGRAPDCHCFGGLRATPVGWATLARNGLLAATAGFVATDGRAPWFFTGLGTIAATCWVVLGLKRSGKVRPGMVTPGFSLPDATGQLWTLDKLFAAAHQPLLLLFTDHACGACDALLPQVARWQQAYAERLTIAIVNGGPAADSVAFSREHGLRNLLVDEGRMLLTTYGLTATPSAMLIDADRILAAAPAAGSAEIADLVTRALQPRGRSTIARRALLFASATMVPAVISTRAMARGVTGANWRPKQVKFAGGWLCKQRYALCTKAACKPSPSDPNVLICRCVVEYGYSYGYKSCAERAPVDGRLVSTFSTQNTNHHTRTMTCTSRAQWANCLDVECEIDPRNPRHAVCRCKSVESGDFFTFGGNCDTSTCTSVIWSAATPPGVPFQAAMESIGLSVTLPKACPTGTDDDDLPPSGLGMEPLWGE
ncbi:MauE/DoxX family redox-associated membrane protein [Streptomyces mirabilis]|uniref:MauE/DoxX family redox-associated membrane protein n=1 Tax=Streptomyces mirabilis TaxID=68239 RepID=UPI00369AEA05